MMGEFGQNFLLYCCEILMVGFASYDCTLAWEQPVVSLVYAYVHTGQWWCTAYHQESCFVGTRH